MSISYRAITIPFGKHTGRVTDRREKIIAYPAVNGTEEMDFGKRQRTWVVTGRMTDMAAGTITPTVLESWNDTSTGALIIHGTTYNNVRCKASWGNVYTDAVTGKMGADFTLNLRQLQT